jgi:RimJ/RimL family protein N-acetyltransferase
MIEVPKKDYHKILKFAENNTCNRVYPLSIAEKNQNGQIFIDSRDNPTHALFWHQCGFAYLSGKPNERFLAEIAALIRNEKRDNVRRFILPLDNNKCGNYFENEIAATVFSSAVSHDEIDIGIETNEKYRKCGLATILAKRMVQYILEEQKKPVWECHTQNMGSRSVPEKVGFCVKSTHPFFRGE